MTVTVSPAVNVAVVAEEPLIVKEADPDGLADSCKVSDPGSGGEVGSKSVCAWACPMANPRISHGSKLLSIVCDKNPFMSLTI